MRLSIRKADPGLRPGNGISATRGIGGGRVAVLLVFAVLALGSAIPLDQCHAAVKPYSQCSSASSDPYERSAARIHQAMNIIEQDLRAITSIGKPSSRLKDAVKDLTAEVNFMRVAAEQGKHSFPPPDFTRILQICDQLQAELQKTEKEYTQYDSKRLELERIKDEAKRVETAMINIITDKQADAILAAIMAVVTGGASAALTVGWAASELVIQITNQLPNTPQSPARDYAQKHKGEIERRLLDQINSKPPAYRDRLKDVLKKMMSGQSLSLREKSDARTLTLMTMQQVKYTARQQQSDIDDQLEQMKKDRKGTEQRIKDLKEAIDICNQIRWLTLWATFVPTPTMTVTKTASGMAVAPGGSVTYTITVTNTGNCPISGVTVNDPDCNPLTYTGGDVNGDHVLDPGEAWTYECTTTLSTVGTVTNTATATGTGPLGKGVTARGTATVTVSKKLVTVPDVVSLSQSAAEYDLREVTLKPFVAGTEKGNVSAGCVSRQFPVAGTRVAEGSVCSLWVAGATSHHIWVDPDRITIQVGDTVHFKASIINDDGSEQDITTIAIWTPGPGGRFIGREAGTFIIKVEYSGLSGAATVNVEEEDRTDWEPPISSADDTLANVPRPGPEDYTWYALCVKDKGEVVYGEETDPTRYIIMGGPFPGPRTAAKWIDDNCPRWRCNLDGTCATDPAIGGKWNVFCNTQTGAITLGKGQPGTGKTILAGGFLGEPDARFWVDSNCPSWRCNTDGTCATEPARGGEWMIICDKETGAVTIGKEKPFGLNYVVMEGGFLGEPDARRWLEMNCPRWRCTADGGCATGPATGGDYYVVCAGDGELEIGSGNAGRFQNRVMADGFLSESDARLWIQINCPTWRCDADGNCLLPRPPDDDELEVDADIDDAIDDVSADASAGDCIGVLSDFSLAADELDGIAIRFNDLSQFFDQEIRMYSPADPDARAAVCKDADIAYALTNASSATDAYDVSYASLAGLYGDLVASCPSDPDFSAAEANYQRLSDQRDELQSKYSRMVADYGVYKCDEQSSETESGDEADDQQDPDDVEAGVEVCGDGIDNDKDGEIDECDAGCCDKDIQITVTDCGPAADDIFLVAVDGSTLGVTPKGQANTFNITLPPGSHTVTVTCLDDGGDPLGTNVGTVCVWVTVFGEEQIGGGEEYIDYGASLKVGFVVPEQAAVPIFPRVIDGSSLQDRD